MATYKEMLDAFHALPARERKTLVTSALNALKPIIAIYESSGEDEEAMIAAVVGYEKIGAGNFQKL